MLIYNFDHGLKVPTTFKVGPFQVSVTKEHCKNLEPLPRFQRYRFANDSMRGRHVESEEPVRGEFKPTAEVSWPEHDEKPESILSGSIADEKGIYDFIILMSFLTGRRAYTADELTWDPRRAYGGSIVRGIELTKFADIAWSNLPKVKAFQLEGALGSLVQVALAPDLIGQCAYASAALDSVVTSWASTNQKTKFDDKELIKKARGTIRQSLLQEGVSADVVDDIVARFNNVSSPSALMKLKWFIQGQGLFPSENTEEEWKRLKRLNTIRNQVAHRGMVNIEEALGADASLTVAAVTVQIIRQIAALYIACDLMGIETAGTGELKKEVREFFGDGIFRGQRVFEESFDEYMARQEQAWVEDGIID